MKIPSKVISYKDSSFSKYSGMLQLLLQREYTPLSLYDELKEMFNGINDYLDALDGLYALRAIEFDEERGVLTYVKGNL